MENVSGRIHMIHNGTRAIFVFGNRYAPDYYEGLVPTTMMEEVDLLARSGMIGIVQSKNSMIKDPTRVRIGLPHKVAGDSGSMSYDPASYLAGTSLRRADCYGNHPPLILAPATADCALLSLTV